MYVFISICITIKFDIKSHLYKSKGKKSILSKIYGMDFLKTEIYHDFM